MGADTLVSVVIPTYNRDAVLVEAVESALGQTVGAIEVIVVDDGSDFNVAGLLASRFDDRRLRCIRQENGGPARARNRGMAQATGRYVAFLDSDDVWLPQKLERQLDLLERDNGATCAACGVEFVDGGRVYRVRDGAAMDAMPRVWLLLSIYTSAFVVRRDCIGEGFDEGYVIGMEDKDFFLRMGLEGRMVVVPEVLVRARRVGDNLTGRFFTTPENALQQDRDVTRFWERFRRHPALDRADRKHLRRKVAILRHDIGANGLLLGLGPVARGNLWWAWRAHPGRLETLGLLVRSVVAGARTTAGT